MLVIFLLKFGQDGIQRFPIQSSYMPEIMKRSSLAHQIDKIVRKDYKVFEIMSNQMHRKQCCEHSFYLGPSLQEVVR